jgi:hypothetical protein
MIMREKNPNSIEYKEFFNHFNKEGHKASHVVLKLLSNGGSYYNY